MKAYRAFDTLQDPALARAWLYRIAGRTALDELRRRKLVRFVPWTGETRGTVASAEETVLRGRLTGELERALAAIPERQRMALLLSELQELNGVELAAALDTSHEAARALLARARESLRQALAIERARAATADARPAASRDPPASARTPATAARRRRSVNPAPPPTPLVWPAALVPIALPPGRPRCARRRSAADRGADGRPADRDGRASARGAPVRLHRLSERRSVPTRTAAAQLQQLRPTVVPRDLGARVFAALDREMAGGAARVRLPDAPGPWRDRAGRPDRRRCRGRGRARRRGAPAAGTGGVRGGSPTRRPPSSRTRPRSRCPAASWPSWSRARMGSRSTRRPSRRSALPRRRGLRRDRPRRAAHRGHAPRTSCRAAWRSTARAGGWRCWRRTPWARTASRW